MPQPFNVYLVNRYANAPRMLNWTDDRRSLLALELRGLFQQVCHGGHFDPRVSWGLGALQPNDLVVHFSSQRSASMFQQFGASLGNESGDTGWVGGNSMLSEVYVAECQGAGAAAMADLAFHECMHNKLDAHPNHHFRSVTDIHTHGGGGLANERPRRPLTARNKSLMRAALPRAIPQYVPRSTP